MVVGRCSRSINNKIETVAMDFNRLLYEVVFSNFDGHAKIIINNRKTVLHIT